MCVRAHAWHVKCHRAQADSKLCTHSRRWRCREKAKRENSATAACVCCCCRILSLLILCISI